MKYDKWIWLAFILIAGIAIVEVFEWLEIFPSAVEAVDIVLALIVIICGVYFIVKQDIEYELEHRNDSVSKWSTTFGKINQNIPDIGKEPVDVSKDFKKKKVDYTKDFPRVQKDNLLVKSEKVNMNRGIFREYDIRGVVDEDLTKDVVTGLGKAFGTVVARDGGKKVAVGYDARVSSPKLFEFFANGVTSCGIDVINVGLVPTPLLYYAVYELNADGGTMITGSHNPPEFNGFKMNLSTSSIHGQAIQKMADMIENNDYSIGSGEVTEADVIESYIDMVKGKTDLKRSVKVVIDSGNGCGGVLAPRLMREIGAEVVELYCEVDGTFPNHHPDPTVPENLNDLIAKVKETGADVGVGYDGDADRIGIVDQEGNILYGDQILMIFARDVLSRKPGSKIVFDVKCSQNLVDDIKKHGGVPVINPTGHSLIKARLVSEKAELAGEMSAHIFFADDYYGFDDAIYATARFLRIMSEKEEKVSEYLADTPKVFNTPEIRLDCPDDEKFRIVEELSKEFIDEKYDVVTIDGARVAVSGGWGLVRASNTQPILVLRFEAQSQERMDEIKSLFIGKLNKFPVFNDLAKL